MRRYRHTFTGICTCFYILFFAGAGQPAQAEEPAPQPVLATEPLAEENDRSIPYRVLVYVPNRILDLLDIVRVRARIGPGFSVGVRATELVSAELSSYTTLYAGLPGPRQKRTIRAPLGAEIYTSAGLSLFSIKTENYGPRYSPSEIGLDVQLVIAGGSIGIDPVEILDFLTGFVGVEIVEDDL